MLNHLKNPIGLNHIRTARILQRLYFEIRLLCFNTINVFCIELNTTNLIWSFHFDLITTKL